MRNFKIKFIITLLIILTFTSCTKTPPPNITRSPVTISPEIQSTISPPLPTETEGEDVEDVKIAYTEEPSSINITFDAKISPEYDLYNFDYYFSCILYKKVGDDSSYSIFDHQAISLKITDIKTEKLIQEIEINHKYYAYESWEPPSINMLDMNFDGYLDVLISADSAKGYNSYLCYIWNPQKGIFVQYDDLKKISKFFIDSKNNYIRTYSRHDAGLYYYDIYEFKNGEILNLYSLMENEQYGDAIRIVETKKVNGDYEIINELIIPLGDEDFKRSDCEDLDRYYGEDSLWNLDSDKWYYQDFIYSYTGSFE